MPMVVNAQVTARIKEYWKTPLGALNTQLPSAVQDALLNQQKVPAFCLHHVPPVNVLLLGKLL